MDIETTTSNLNNYVNFLNEAVLGKINFSSEEGKELDDKGSEVLRNASSDLLIAKLSKIANADITAKNVDFRFFEKLPKTWRICQQAVEISCRK